MDTTTKICSKDGCARPHRAKGYCSTHYNQTLPTRHKLRISACTICGTQVARGIKNDRRPVCSAACRKILSGHVKTYDRAIDAMNRARQLGATIIEYIDPLDIFERDAWTCYLCGDTLSPDADPISSKAATIDHVLALSRNGQHTRSNVSTCCLSCNGSKSDLVIDHTRMGGLLTSGL